MASFSPYNISQFTPNQQKQGGFFDFNTPGTCDGAVTNYGASLPNPGKLIFQRIDPDLNNTAFYGYLTDPNALPCASYISCGLREVTYYPMPNFFDLGVLNNLITNKKYYYVDPLDGSLHQNYKMTNHTDIIGGTAIPSKKVCYSHLLDNRGQAVTNNYVVVYTIKVAFSNVSNPSKPFIDYYDCDIPLNVTVTPSVVKDLTVAGQDALDLLSDRFSILKGLWPLLSDEAICNIMFSILPTNLDEPTPIEFISRTEEISNIHANNSFNYGALLNEGAVISKYWFQNGKYLCEEFEFDVNKINSNNVYTLASYVNDELFMIEREVNFVKNDRPEFLSLNQLFGDEKANEYRSFLTDEQNLNPLISDTSKINPSTPKINENLPRKISTRKVDASVFPNPTNGEFTITSNGVIKNVEIIDLFGKTIKIKQNLDSKSVNINEFQPSANGVYLIKMTFIDGSLLTKRLIFSNNE